MSTLLRKIQIITQLQLRRHVERQTPLARFVLNLQFKLSICITLFYKLNLIP